MYTTTTTPLSRGSSPVAGMSGGPAPATPRAAAPQTNYAATLRDQATRKFFELIQASHTLLPTKVALPENPRFKQIGILGGMGPAAGIDTAAKLVAYAQKDKGCSTDQQVPKFDLTSFSAEIPDRTGYLLREVLPKASAAEKSAALTAATPDNPYWGMQHSIDHLQKGGAKVIMMPCNTAHGWFDHLQAKPGVKMVHIVDSVIAAIDKDPALAAKPIKTVGLMATSGTINCGIYTERLAKLGRADIRFVVPSPEVQETQVMGGIYGRPGDAAAGGIKGGDTSKTGLSHDRLAAAAEHLISEHGADVLSYSCTEIPLVLDETEFAVPGIDATKAMVHEAVDEAERMAQAAAAPRATAPLPERLGETLHPFGHA